ncbi:hypothetical protein SUDANB120_00848 [Streptomyces sp. enrichment culture]
MPRARRPSAPRHVLHPAMPISSVALARRCVPELGRDPFRPLRRDWERVKDDVMRRAVAATFRAHADIRDILLSTVDEEIAEDTATDHHWGRGRTGTGENMLGRIPMRTRNQLRAEGRDQSG